MSTINFIVQFITSLPLESAVLLSLCTRGKSMFIFKPQVSIWHSLDFREDKPIILPACLCREMLTHLKWLSEKRKQMYLIYSKHTTSCP